MTAPAAPAATVLVVRDGPGGVEVYLQRRPRRMGFAGGLWVFPGGRVDDADRDAAIDAHWTGPPPADWADLLGVPVDAARGYVVAACRETLEEAGMLLVEPAPPAPDVVAARRRLLAGTATFADVVRDLGATLDTALLRYWAWWVTPETEPRRYDTRFFLATLPRGAAVTPHDDEVVEEAWLSAPLRDVAMLPPTHYTLADVLPCRSAAAAMDAAADRAVERVMPRIEGREIVLPWNDRYPMPSTPTAGA